MHQKILSSGWRIAAGLVLASLALAFAPALSVSRAQSGACSQAILHYRRAGGDYEGWGLHIWGPTRDRVAWEQPLEPAGQDDFGMYWEVGLQEGAAVLNDIVHRGDTKDPGPDQTLTFAESGCEIWLVQGLETRFSDPQEAQAALEARGGLAPEVGENQVLLHYRRVRGDYDGWGLHVWGPTHEQVTWTAPLLPAGQDDYGLFWVVAMEPGAQVLNYLVHKGDEKDPGPDQSLDLIGFGREAWLIEGSVEPFRSPQDARQALLVAGVGDIKNKAQAHWLTAGTIAWPLPYGPKATYRLHYDPDGAIQVTQDGLLGGESLGLTFVDDNLPAELAGRFPHLRAAVTLQLPPEALGQVPEMLRGQLAVSVTGPDGRILGATGLQVAGVLDDLYANDEPLGVVWDGGSPSVRLWAPIARQVRLRLYRDPHSETPLDVIPMNRDAITGVWTASGEPAWNGLYYLYDVEVFIRQEGQVVQNLVTDPYSLSLSMNSARSQIVNLGDPALLPDGWEAQSSPPLNGPQDIVLYELHLRDFSAGDPSVPPGHRGRYLAFTYPDSNGMRHLRGLAQAGVTHIHLLPVFDIATIDEDPARRLELDLAGLAGLPPDSPEQQAILGESRGQDGYNWGYDPYHYTVPEGSYATDPDGSARVLEFRQMVQSLHQAGLRVVMDVVYNHTHAAGQSEKSVLDRVVPGYYHRLDLDGNVTTSTCCPNTASEHAMMEKLMRDSLRTWATAYRVDGFRFDLMGHHLRANMEKVQAELSSLTLAQDGVDGRAIYLYGEGWDFGEMANNARGINASQRNLAGTGIGTFNDRLRDAARGGNPFGGLQEQGYITGLYTDPNEIDTLPEESRLALLLDLKDLIRVSLAGNLADYTLVNASGATVTGAQVGYNGQPAGYTASPLENVLYISAHDNETLFDAIQYKVPPGTSMEERVRIQNLGMSLVALGQGVPFFHAGAELLRSKSLDRDSYDSGDWFNRLDFTYQSNNWGVGLPPEDKNAGNWPVMRSLLARPELRPAPQHIQAARAHFEELLQIRRSSPLFRLRSAEEVQGRVRFHNTGAEQVPGLIVMSLSGTASAELAPDLIVVLFNADPATQSFSLGDLRDGDLRLHPLQAESADPRVRTARFEPATNTFTVPGRSSAVFVGRGRLEGMPLSAESETTIAAPEEGRQPGEAAQASASGPAPPPTIPTWALALGAALVAGLFLAGKAYR